MTSFNRWCVVALGLLLVIAVPVLLRTIPGDSSDITATALLEQVDAAEGRSWSGYVETRGALR